MLGIIDNNQQNTYAEVEEIGQMYRPSHKMIIWYGFGELWKALGGNMDNEDRVEIQNNFTHITEDSTKMTELHTAGQGSQCEGTIKNTKMTSIILKNNFSEIEKKHDDVTSV